MPDLNNEQDARTLFTFHGAVRVDIEVARDPKKKLFDAKASWGSRQGLSLNEAEDFANAILEGVCRARIDAARRNEMPLKKKIKP